MAGTARPTNSGSTRVIHGTKVCGRDVGGQTRCAHYDGPHDVIAIRFACCDEWYPCAACHAACTEHEAAVWPQSAWTTEAVLCGVCGLRLSIQTYLRRSADNQHVCPSCAAPFNPGCARHHDRYFAV